MQVYSEEQIGQKEIQSVEFGEEEDTGKANVTAEACAGRSKLLKVAKSAFEWTEGCPQGETPLS